MNNGVTSTIKLDAALQQRIVDKFKRAVRLYYYWHSDMSDKLMIIIIRLITSNGETTKILSTKKKSRRCQKRNDLGKRQ